MYLQNSPNDKIMANSIPLAKFTAKFVIRLIFNPHICIGKIE